MAKIIAISSFVAAGGVGLRAHMGVFCGRGDSLVAVPTVFLSSHLGHNAVATAPISASDFYNSIDALTKNGSFDDVSAVLTGYLPTPDHVTATAELVQTMARRGASIVVDPVLGDDPGGLYIDEDAANAVRTSLIGHANIITPNRFELAYLTGADINTVALAHDACRRFAPTTVIATSIPDGADRLATLAISPDQALAVTSQKRPNAPHGTGDLLAALITRHTLAGHNLSDILQRSVAAVDHAIAIAPCDRKDIAPFADDWFAIAASTRFTVRSL